MEFDRDVAPSASETAADLQQSCRPRFTAALLVGCLVMALLSASSCRAVTITEQPWKPVRLHSGSTITIVHGADGLCAKVPKLTLITPWGRAQMDYLPVVSRSIKWDCIAQWIIAYDLHKVHLRTPQFKNNSKVLELFYNAPNSKSGNLQRQEALNTVTDGMVYFLDDDNSMHPKFWQWYAANAALGHIYTFDQLRGTVPLLLRGDKPVVNCIDTAQLLFDRALVGNVSWIANDYAGDGRFIQALVEQHRENHIYVPEVLAYHNFVQHYLANVSWTQLPSPNATTSNGTYPC